MPPLECANFLECENKTVIMRGPLRLPSTFFLDPTPVFFHHIPENCHNSPCWRFFFLFLAKMAWNAIVCETTDVSRENSIFPIFQKTWFQAILTQKNEKTKKTEKKKKHGVRRRFYGVRRSCRVREFYNMCTSRCGVRCPMWSAKKLWNAKNSEYSWLV